MQFRGWKGAEAAIFASLLSGGWAVADRAFCEEVGGFYLWVRSVAVRP